MLTLQMLLQRASAAVAAAAYSDATQLNLSE